MVALREMERRLADFDKVEAALKDVRPIAADVTPELKRRIDEWLKSDMLLGSKEYCSLVQHLWDNKIGLLRIAEAINT